MTPRPRTHPGVAAAVREALGLRAVLRLRRLHLSRGRAPVPVRDPGRVHPGAAGRPLEPAAGWAGGRSRAGRRSSSSTSTSSRAGAVHRLLRPEAVGRLRPAVSRGARSCSPRSTGMAAARRRLDRHPLRRRGRRAARGATTAPPRPVGAAPAPRHPGRAAGGGALPHRSRRGQPRGPARQRAAST